MIEQIKMEGDRGVGKRGIERENIDTGGVGTVREKSNLRYGLMRIAYHTQIRGYYEIYILMIEIKR